MASVQRSAPAERQPEQPAPHRFGQPSSYSLSSRELAAEIRRRRREGWQSWEIRARFDFWRTA
jgi:hypothetical protein